MTQEEIGKLAIVLGMEFEKMVITKSLALKLVKFLMFP